MSLAYDAYFPRLTGMTDGNSATSYSYFQTGVTGALQLASEDGPFANDGIAYTYDALGRVQNRTLDTVPDKFAYDLLGRLVDHTTPLAEFAYAYLGATDQRTRRSVVGNAVAACPGSVRNEHAAEQNTCTGIGHAYGIQRRTAATLVSTWQYADNLHDRRLTGITHLDGGAPAGARPRSYTYVTDPENRILGLTESGTPARTWTYGYDAADRLTDAVSPDGAYGYDLDPGDNPLGIQTPASATTTTYDPVNRIDRRNAQPFTWDAAGNLADDGQRSYAWDAEQRLIRIRYTGTSKYTEFRYDGLGRRTAVIDSDGTTATETRYLWCGERLCQARDGTDTVTRRYYAEGELAVAATGDVAIVYAEDHLGSIRDLRLGDGQVLASYDYDPYGNPTRTTSTNGIRADYRYAGLFYHAPSGLYLTHYRVYDPGTARWLSRDPIGEIGGVNLYTYVGGNPVSFVDPRGLWGFGFQGGGTIEAGTVAGGAAQANGGVGVFGGGNAGVNVGGYTAKGGFFDAPNAKQWVAGLTVGAGGGLFFTNAKCAKQLLGPFDTWTVNLPILSIQYATDGTIGVGSISIGKSWGFSVSRYSVTTETASGCECQ